MGSDLDHRFNELRQLVDSEIAHARSDIIHAIAQTISRMRAAKDEAEWHDAVLESGRPFAGDPAALQLIGTLAHLTAPATGQAAGVLRDAASGSAAQRFARVKVAQMQLYHADAVAAGRASRNLYGKLKGQIDEARAAFRDQFLQNGSRAADELHTEIVHALANDDPALLGPDYPGPENEHTQA